MKLPVHHLHTYRSLIRDIVFRPPLDNPIFIVGSPNSGTTLLSRIIGAHHAIYLVPGETNAWVDYRIHKPKWLRIIIFRLCDFACRANGKLRWIEKTPSHAKHIDQIFERYPLAKILWIIRDGRDVIASLRKEYEMEKCLAYWKDCNEAMLPWNDNPQIYKLHYEDLITDFDNTLEGIMSFLGMPVDPIQKHFYRLKKEMFFGGRNRDGDTLQYRNWQTNMPITDCRGRWKALPDDEKQNINEALGNLLIKFGYERCS